ncbi:MAG: carboxypeptidase-like regulatory domain-containing protein, partial [Psychroserpens sp.]|nr:carboxypeptidase-like regulatory domain-containing protein [Psychroserpens sp.]
MSFLGFSQTATIKGVILDDADLPIDDVNIQAGDRGTTSNENGFYELKIPANVDVTVVFTHISHKRVEATFNLKNGEEIEFNPVMDVSVEQIATVVINSNTKQS